MRGSACICYARRVTVIQLRATCALTLLLFSAPAVAQDAPVIVTPPVGDFSLPPSGQTPTPRPTATPAPAPTTTPAPVRPLPTATPTPSRPATRATPAPRPTPTSTPAPRATATPAPASAAPAPTAIETPAAALPTPEPDASPTVSSELTPQIAPAPAPARDGLPFWLIALLGGGALLAAGLGAGWLLGRRKRDVDEAPRLLTAPVDAPPAPPAIPATPPAPTPSPPARVSTPAPAPASPPVPAPEGTLVTELRPLRAAIREGKVLLDFELFVQNRGTESADNIRAVLALLGANAQQDEQLASFYGAARMAPGSEPFSIAPGGVFMLNGQVSLPDDAMPAVQVQGRTMFVPIVPVALRWYAGLSIKTLRDGFMVGTVPAPGSDKLGPLWLDRAPVGFGPLAAKRYVAKPLG